MFYLPDNYPMFEPVYLGTRISACYVCDCEERRKLSEDSTSVNSRVKFTQKISFERIYELEYLNFIFPSWE